MRRAPPSRLALGAIVVLTALNLRTAIASVPPLLDEITRDVALSAAAAGLLTALPPLCMAAGAPFAPWVARRLGHEAGLLIVALTIAGGILVRTPGGAAPLFLGTILACLGVALGNVLVPALIKREFPDRIGLMTGLLTMAMSASAAIGAALAVPAENVLATDWRGSLAIWCVPALAAALLWMPRVAEGRRVAQRAEPPPPPSTALLRDRVAVQVTLFMGMQSLSFYSLLSWLPEILRDAGISRGASGTLLSIMLVTGIPGCLTVPVLAARLRDQRVAVAATVAALGAGIAGLLFAVDLALLWVTLAGFAQGALLGLGFLFFGIRTRDAFGAGRLAAMAQTFGYLIAATGPFAVGALRDLTGDWTAPLVLLLVAAVPILVAGLGAGRDRLVQA